MQYFEDAQPELVTIEFSEWLAMHIQDNTLLLLCGGSAIPMIAKAWASLAPEVQQRATVTLTDERFGPVGHSDSNWLQLENAGIRVSPARSIPVLIGEETAEDSASAWSSKLEDVIKHANKVVAVFGIGTDSHIAGIKPRSSALLSDAFAASFEGEDFTRVTITPRFFEYITSAAILTQGEAKRAALHQLNETLEPSDFPSQLIKQVPDVRIFHTT